MKRYLLALLFLVCGCMEPSRTPPSDVDALVSSNSPTTGDWTEKLPAAWSDEENARVWTAYRKLVARGKDAVPLLLDNVDRKEFSTCISSAVPYSPQSVGNICQMALNNMFDPIGMMYKSRRNAKGEHLMGTSFFSQLCISKSDAKTWWEKHRHKSMPEIRELVKAWHIQRETSFGFIDDEQKKMVLTGIEERFSRDSMERVSKDPM